MTGTMFGNNISQATFTQNGNTITGSMVISGAFGSVRQHFTGTINGNTVSLQGTQVDVLNMQPGIRYHPDNLQLTQQADGSWAGTATCTGRGGTSQIVLRGP